MLWCSIYLYYTALLNKARIHVLCIGDSCYAARIQRRNRYVKLRRFDQHFSNHEVSVEIDNPNSIHAFNRFEEEGHADRENNHFRLMDLTREHLYAMGVPAILDDDEKK